jgi:hypothetical protein
MTNVVKSISAHFDRSNETLWFSGELVSGGRFDIGFPIAHVAVTFDSNMAALNFVADPVCGSIVSVEGFLQNYEAVCNCSNRNASEAARNAYEETIGDLSSQAMHYAAAGHDVVIGAPWSKATGSKHDWLEHELHFIATKLGGKAPKWDDSKFSEDAPVWVAKLAKGAGLLSALALIRPLTDSDYRDLGLNKNTPDLLSQIGKAAGSVAKGVVKVAETGVRLTTAPARAAINIGKAAVTGQNIAKAAYAEVKSSVQDLKTVAPIAQTVFSVVPGVGTLASVAIGATQAALSGKSLTEIVKAAGVSAIPGGPLAQQIARAGINTIQAGVEGKNMLKAAAQNTISAVASAIPDATARALLERVALDAAAGKNVLQAAERAAVDTAINMIPDPTARDVARRAVTGNLNPQSVLSELTRSVVGKAASPEAMRTLVSGSVDSLGKLGTSGVAGLKTAAAELIEVSSNFVPDAAARSTLQTAVASAMQGKRVGAVGPVAQALTKVTDPNARAVLTSIVQGKTEPSQIIESADPTYLATLVTLDPNSHLAKALVQGQTIVSGPSGIMAPVRKITAQQFAASAVVPAMKIPAHSSSSPFAAIGARGLYQWRQSLRG